MSKIAMVTGASGGIGCACALALLAEGWQVILVGRREDALRTTADAAGSARAAAHVAPADVSDPAAVTRLFADVRREHGRLDLLVNNAGIFTPSVPPDQTTLDDWHRSVAVNLNGAFYCLSQAFALMREQQPQGGRIINNGSISATTPRPNSIAYTATKHAVTGLTKTASLDGRKYHIAVGQIDIGNAATDMTQRMRAGILQANGDVAVEPVMDVAIVGQSIVYMANLPLEANVMFHTVMATRMPFVGRG